MRNYPETEQYLTDPEDTSSEQGVFEPVLFDRELATEFPIAYSETSDTGSAEDSELKKLTPYERIAVVRNEAGFFASSSRELNLALGAIEHRDEPGGFGHYLNDVLIHQQKSVSDNPERALRSIVEDIKGFGRSAAPTISILQLLTRELPEGNFEALASSSQLQNWKYQESTRRALRTLVHRNKQREMQPEGENLNLNAAITDEEVEDYLSVTRRYQAITDIITVSAEQEARQGFWLETLKSSESHMVIRKMARQAIVDMENE